MPEEVTPTTGNTTAAEATQIDWESPDNPYIQRHREAQSHLTPIQQENARLRALEDDRDAWMALGEKHGVQFEIEEPPAPTGDPQTAQELAELRAWKDEVQQERQDRAYAEGEKAVRSQHDQWAKEADIELDDFDHDAIIKRALDSGATTLEEVKDIFDAYVDRNKTRTEQLRERFEQERKRPRVPTPPAAGGAATGTKAMHELTRAERDDLAYERAASQT